MSYGLAGITAHIARARTREAQSATLWADYAHACEAEAVLLHRENTEAATLPRSLFQQRENSGAATALAALRHHYARAREGSSLNRPTPRSGSLAQPTQQLFRQRALGMAA